MKDGENIVKQKLNPWYQKVKNYTRKSRNLRDQIKLNFQNLHHHSQPSFLYQNEIHNYAVPKAEIRAPARLISPSVGFPLTESSSRPSQKYCQLWLHRTLAPEPGKPTHIIQPMVTELCIINLHNLGGDINIAVLHGVTIW